MYQSTQLEVGGKGEGKGGLVEFPLAFFPALSLHPNPGKR